MQKRMTFAEISDKYICVLIVFAALFMPDITIEGLPLYIFLLLLIALAWMITKIIAAGRERRAFLEIRNLTDIAAIAAILYSLLSIGAKLFQNPEDGAIDIAGNTETLAFALLYLLLSAGTTFRFLYFDLILYSGLVFMGSFIFPCFTGMEPVFLTGTMFTDSGAAASFLLLICMVGSYGYCTCKDRLRSWFYVLVTTVGFVSLFLNQNVLSFWFLTAYFIAVPVCLRPTAQLVKKNMQLFFLYGFLLANMSLITGYTDIFQKELSYSLEHSVYLELLLAVGGIFFFHYWEKVPEGIDLDRLVMRRLRRGYRFTAHMLTILFVGIMLGGTKWQALADTMTGKMWKSFALPLVSSVSGEKSGFYVCFQELGMTAGIFAIVFCILLFDRLRRNYSFDKPVTGFLILVSGFFLLQLFFWKPTANTLTIYLILFFSAAFSKEERIRVTSTKIRKEELTGKALLQKI